MLLNHGFLVPTLRSSLWKYYGHHQWLGVQFRNICVTNDHRYAPLVVITNQICNKNNKTGATDGAGKSPPFRKTWVHPRFSVGFVFSLTQSTKLPTCSSNLSWFQVRVITVFTVFRLLTDFVCLYNYEFWLSLCKIVRSSVILLLPLFIYYGKLSSYNIREQLEQ